jgi:hypothetical protein
VAIAVAVATAGAGVSVLVSGVGARDVGGCFPVTTVERVIVSCYGDGGTVTVPASTEVTVAVSGASGGAVGATPGGRGGRVEARWTPPEDTVLHVTLGEQGSPGSTVGVPRGGSGGEASLVAKQGAPVSGDPSTLPANWLWVAGGGGGAGVGDADATGGHGGSPDGGPDSPAAGAATGATQSAPGRGGGIFGHDGHGSQGGHGHLGGGGGGDGFYGGGSSAFGGGGGGGSSNAAVGTATYGVAGEPGDGTATISWSLVAAATAPPQITSAADAGFVVGERGTFIVSATGEPVPQLTVGPLPPGLAFADHGDGTSVISGIPTADAAGTTVVDVTAANGAGPDATQKLRVSVTAPAGPPASTTTTPPPPFTPDFTPDQTTTAAQQDPDPDPELVPVADESVVVVPVSGTVLVRRPDGTVSELKEGGEIPVGSVVDARDGVVRLTSARDAGGAVQTAVFWNAIFRVTQRPDTSSGADARAATASDALLTELTLRQNASGCAKSRQHRHRQQQQQRHRQRHRHRHRARAAAKPRKKRGRGGLWGDGEGRFRVRGESSSATVRGTKWYVENRCEGTYTRVVRGVVEVRDFTRKKTIFLQAGETYTARRRGA